MAASALLDAIPRASSGAPRPPTRGAEIRTEGDSF